MAMLRQVYGYAVKTNKRPTSIRQLRGYAVVGAALPFSMTKASKAMFVDLINQVSSETLTLDQIEIGAPSAIEGASQNTRVTITATETSGYRGTMELDYRRISFERLFRYGSLTDPLTAVTSLQDALNQINNRFGTHLSLDDVVDQNLSGETQVTLTTSDAGYLLRPGQSMTIGA